LNGFRRGAVQAALLDVCEPPVGTMPDSNLQDCFIVA
jgi:hypothetical protein